jgi:imidazolonepropionase-like amidohydrolase
MKYIALCFILLTRFSTYAQIRPPVNGVPDNRQTTYAITGATVHKSAAEVIPDAILLVKNGKIIGVGKDLNIPKDAVVIPYQGKHIYPAFIDVSTSYGLLPNKEITRGVQMLERPDPGAIAWNMAIHPEYRAINQFKFKASEALTYRKMGFSTVCSFSKDGIMRGSGCVVSLADKQEAELILKSDGITGLSFQKGSSLQEYPNSFAGSVALLRQSIIDADWYSMNKEDVYHNESYESWEAQKKLPALFETKHWQDVLKSIEIANEFKLNLFIEGNGDEYLIADEIKSSGAKVCIPINFPQALDLSDSEVEEKVSLSTLLHWEAAPANPAYLYKKGISFAISSAGITDEENLFAQLRKAHAAGLPPSEILKALTINPAEILGISNRTGTININYDASFIVCSDTLLHPQNRILENWANGQRLQFDAVLHQDISGIYEGIIAQDSLKITIKGKSSSPELEGKMGDLKIKAKITLSGFNVQIKLNKSESDILHLNGILNKDKSLSGSGVNENGSSINWEFNKVGELPVDTAKDDQLLVLHADSLKIRFPFTGFGYNQKPKEETLIITNTTIWTNESEGIRSGSLLIENGKIVALGNESELRKRISDPNKLKLIDGTGKHVTSGIIDEHSHIALSRGVNEGTQNNTAEVRMGDALDATDIDIYRQLAGGVTTAQLLHGSSNPIGGQSAVIKFKWGEFGNNLLISDAPKHIKFALGENVKQSNWGSQKTVRFPQTRMGVEQVFYDAFQRAQEYKKARELWKNFSEKEKKNKTEPLRDLELEAIAEILDGQRNITCHSYVQSEINMLMHVADSMHFKVNTFTHILEGYKVADKLKMHGANASTFSDWWAYKWEVNDAIPYNGSLLNKMGVVTGFNSDDAEMGRRLNQEAAKAILYGGATEEEALKFVTLNPAKMLKIDHRTGSLKPGKDADVVIWSDNPLSVYAKVEQTFVEGKRYFDVEQDKKLQELNRADRLRIVQKMKKEKLSGKSLKKPKIGIKHYYTCDDLYHEFETE